MHASPSDFRAVRRDGVVLHFALLDTVAYVIADFPVTGSSGTFVEAPCEEAHWAFVVAGDVQIEVGGERRDVPQGSAFHIPAGLEHRIIVPDRARVAGFARVAPDAPTTDDALQGAGFEIVRSRGPRAAVSAVSVIQAGAEPAVEGGEVRATSRRMGDLIYTRTRMGRRAGYTGELCDLPHWGLVTAGSLAIESEDDIEVLTAGDVFYCPPGPPAHRLQAAEPAVVLDFTPVDAFRSAERIAEWRRSAGATAATDPVPAPRVEIVALA